MEPEILYEDAQIIVCRKPAGVATQTRRIGEKDMVSILTNHAAAAGEPPFIGVVHRLDQPVSGVMVFAKTKQAAAKLSAQVQNGTFEKRYCAAVVLPDGKDFAAATGCGETGTLCDWLLTDKRANVTHVVPEGTAGAKKAVLDYRVVREQPGQALLDITLHTGRQHQIRVQLAHLGTPIIGDRKYGGASEGALQLRSCRIAFLHPADGRKVSWEIPFG